MGQIVRAKCTACAFEKDLFIGGGMRDCNLDVITSPLPENVREIVEKAVKGGMGRASIERRACVCSSCGELNAVSVVSYSGGGIERDFYSACPKCGGISYTEIENGKTACPDCGAAITLAPAGHWD